MILKGLTVELLDPGTGSLCPVLHNMTVSLVPGQITGVTGPSGGGKTTLALALAGLLPDSARVQFEHCQLGTFQKDRGDMRGEEWSREVRAGLGASAFFISQDARSTLFPYRSVEWHLQRADEIAHPVRRTVTAWSPLAALEEAGFRQPERFLKRLPGELSTGECQRIQWAMACRLPLKILFADEPFASVDEPLAARLAQKLKDQAPTFEGGILLVSHHLILLRNVASTVLVMHQGRLAPQNAATVVQPAAPPSSPVRPALETTAIPRNDAEDLVRATGLTKTFAPRGWRRTRPATIAFRDRQLTIPVGARVGLVGDSGAGKTTLARLVMGLCDATSGEIVRQLDDRCLNGSLTSAACRQLWRTFQMVHQDTDLVFDPACRLGDSLVQVRHASQPRISPPAAWENAGEWLRRFGLSPKMLLSPATRLSGGEKRRAAIVRGLLALGVDPPSNVPAAATSSVRRLLVLDEPTVGLDQFWQRAVIDELLAVLKTRGMTYLVISHDRNFVREFCDLVVEWPS